MEKASLLQVHRLFLLNYYIGNCAYDIFFIRTYPNAIKKKKKKKKNLSLISPEKGAKELYTLYIFLLTDCFVIVIQGGKFSLVN